MVLYYYTMKHYRVYSMIKKEDWYGRNALKVFVFFVNVHCTTKQNVLLFISLAFSGSGRGYNQANNKISLDQITSALVVNDTAKFGAPGAKNVHLLGICSS